MEKFLYHAFMWLAHFFNSRSNRLHIVVQTSSSTIKGNNMDITIAQGGTTTLGLTLDADAAGLATTLLPGPVLWTAVPDAAAALVPAIDGLTVQVTSLTADSFVVTATSGTLTDSSSFTVTPTPVVPGVTTGIHIVQLPDTPVAADPVAAAAVSDTAA